MDAVAIEAAEAAVHPNFPPADTILIVELDGPSAEVAELFGIVEATCRRCGSDACRGGPGRSAAGADLEGAEGRVRGDGAHLAELLRAGRRRAAHEAARSPRRGSVSSAEREGLRIGNVFHAGDGNLHPLICYDERIEGQSALAERVAGEILIYCVEAGGSITGEHGVGADKKEFMPKMFSDDSLDVMQSVRDALDPKRLCNPGKVLPTPRLCGEVPGPYREHPVERAGLGRALLMSVSEAAATGNQLKTRSMASFRSAWRCRRVPRSWRRSSRTHHAIDNSPCCAAVAPSSNGAASPIASISSSEPQSSIALARASPRRHDRHRAGRHAARDCSIAVSPSTGSTCPSKARSMRPLSAELSRPTTPDRCAIASARRATC